MKYFQRLSIRQWVLIGIGILVGVALYQFMNGFYTGIQLGLNSKP